MHFCTIDILPRFYHLNGDIAFPNLAGSFPKHWALLTNRVRDKQNRWWGRESSETMPVIAASAWMTNDAEGSLPGGGGLVDSHPQVPLITTLHVFIRCFSRRFFLEWFTQMGGTRPLICAWIPSTSSDTFPRTAETSRRILLKGECPVLGIYHLYLSCSSSAFSK